MSLPFEDIFLNSMGIPRDVAFLEMSCQKESHIHLQLLHLLMNE